MVLLKPFSNLKNKSLNEINESDREERFYSYWCPMARVMGYKLFVCLQVIDENDDTFYKKLKPI